MKFSGSLGAASACSRPLKSQRKCRRLPNSAMHSILLLVRWPGFVILLGSRSLRCSIVSSLRWVLRMPGHQLPSQSLERSRCIWLPSILACLLPGCLIQPCTPLLIICTGFRSVIRPSLKTWPSCAGSFAGPLTKVSIPARFTKRLNQNLKGRTVIVRRSFI